jgi:hypothetical protein
MGNNYSHDILFNQFLTALKSPDKQCLSILFDKYDKEKKGYITSKEFNLLLKKLGSVDHKLEISNKNLDEDLQYESHKDFLKTLSEVNIFEKYEDHLVKSEFIEFFLLKFYSDHIKQEFFCSLYDVVINVEDISKIQENFEKIIKDYNKKIICFDKVEINIFMTKLLDYSKKGN